MAAGVVVGLVAQLVDGVVVLAAQRSLAVVQVIEDVASAGQASSGSVCDQGLDGLLISGGCCPVTA